MKQWHPIDQSSILPHYFPLNPTLQNLMYLRLQNPKAFGATRRHFKALANLEALIKEKEEVETQTTQTDP